MKSTLPSPIDEQFTPLARPEGHLSSVTDWIGLAEKSKFRVSALARLVGVSERMLERHFQQTAAVLGPKAWLEQVRLWKAAERLVTGTNLKCVADELGFTDCSHLCRLFKRYFRFGPSEFTISYRRQVLGAERDGVYRDPPPPIPRALQVLDDQPKQHRTRFMAYASPTPQHHEHVGNIQ